ncbi:unnamed protein product, partial [Prorocentrum cordatum]
MVIPLGPLGAGGATPPQSQQAPDVVKESHATWWWLLALLLLVLAVGRIVAGDVFGALAIVLIAFIAWSMVRDGCAGMSQSCVMMFGLMCAIQTVFELINLATNAGGRKTTTVTPAAVDGNTMTYTTTVETHPFFDEAQGWHYNFQSATMVAAPVVMFLGGALAYVSYRHYPSALFSDDGGLEGGSVLGGGFGGAPPSAAGYGSGGGGGAAYGTPGRALGASAT